MIVSIVCDNRFLMKKVYKALSEEENCSVYIIPSSITAVDDLIKLNPSIVIIDEDTVIPWETVLEQFFQINRNFKGIVLKSELFKKDEFRGRWIYLSKHNRFQESLSQYVNDILNNRLYESAGISISARSYIENEKSLFYNVKLCKNKQGIYSIFIIKFINYLSSILLKEIADERLSIMESLLEGHENAEIIKVNEEEIIIVIGKTQKKVTTSTIDFTQQVIDSYERKCAVYIADNLTLDNLEESYEWINSNKNYNYFFIGQVSNIKSVRLQKKEMDISEINKNLIEIVGGVFNGEKEEVTLSLRNLMFNIRECIDYNSIKYLRRLTYVFEKFFYSLAKENNLIDFNGGVYFEQEFNEILERYYKIIYIIKDKKISPIIKSVTLYILGNYKNDISLDDLAIKISMSKNYLSRVIKEETNYNFIELLQGTRMQIAQHLLINTNNRIAYIAKETGYNDSQYFSRVFKKRLGCSPEVYRKLAGESSDESGS